MRDDMSTKLVHLTKVSSKRENIDGKLMQISISPRSVLEKILNEKQLKAGSGYILGGEVNSSVCFSEAPISKLLSELGQNKTKYMPFGVLLDKKLIFDLGGRPAIYQPNSYYSDLPESQRYRHVRFEYPNIDFTWEREWRLRGSISLKPAEISVIVPNREEKEAVSLAVGDGWHYLVLDDLGMPMDENSWANIPEPVEMAGI